MAQIKPPTVTVNRTPTINYPGPLSKATQPTRGSIISNAKPLPTAANPNIALAGTNKSILKGLGLDIDTVLTPKGKRKKKAGLVGGDVEELAALLGE